METRANHVLIGAFTLLAVLVAVVFALWTARYATSADYVEYQVRFRQAVTGLYEGSTVQYNGIGVGTVQQLTLAPEDPRQVLARIRVDADAPVKVDTVARLQLAGLTGTTFIQLTGGSPKSPLLEAKRGEELPTIRAEESALDKLFDASEGIADATNEILLRLLELMSEENTARIGDSIANLHGFTEALNAERSELEGTFRNIERTSAAAERTIRGAERTIAQVNESLEVVNAELIQRLPALSEDASTTLENLRNLSARADRMLADNADSFGGLGPAGLGQLGPTLQELQVLLKDLSRVTRSFQQAPAQGLLGGGAPEEYQPE
jgi:phospholipid/cholesterol/gamma-HCH transport system substrate-binding protein